VERDLWCFLLTSLTFVFGMILGARSDGQYQSLYDNVDRESLILALIFEKICWSPPGARQLACSWRARKFVYPLKPRQKWTASTTNKMGFTYIDFPYLDLRCLIGWTGFN